MNKLGRIRERKKTISLTLARDEDFPYSNLKEPIAVKWKARTLLQNPGILNEVEKILWEFGEI